MTGCYELAGLYFEGYGVRQDYQKAASLHQKACDGGNMLSCDLLAILYEYGIGAPTRDKHKAMVLRQMICDNGDADMCNNLAYLYKNGDKVRQDLQKAEILYKKRLFCTKRKLK